MERIENVQTYLNNITLKATHSLVDDLCSNIPVQKDTCLLLKSELSVILFKGAIISGGKHSDYQLNLLIPIMRKIHDKIGHLLNQKLTPNMLAQLMEQKILEFDTRSVIGNTHIIKVYVNINISSRFLLNNALHLAVNAGNAELGEHFSEFDDTEQRIVLDYSSPNVAKEMHIGHLRSTIIGDSLYRLLCLFIPKDRILCLNHIGDWGTQFGMIINYLRYIHPDFTAIIKFLENATASDLLQIYRSAKICFDNKNGQGEYDNFANESRHQTYCLQQGKDSDCTEVRMLNAENIEIWKEICRISSIAYSDVYSKLGISNDLTERGESFYNEFIPHVLAEIMDAGLIEMIEGANMIEMEGWGFPLIVVKSDGGYTYATTDLAAIWHRIFVEKATKIIYITDKGQESHFEKVFDVARKMGWVKNVELIHIGFGLVSGKDGKKLKTRSGDTVKLVDVIDEVTSISREIIEGRVERAMAGEDVHDGYTEVDLEQISDMSIKIAINTLKYYDLSFLTQSNYKYDPVKMFEFQGDTGVYQMYAYCRILSIIDKSDYSLDDTVQNSLELLYALDQNEGDPTTIPDFEDLSNIDRDLMFEISRFHSVFEECYQTLTIKPIMNYIYCLTTQFSRFVSKQNVNIINADTQKFRVTLCALVYHILDLIFDTIGMGKIDFI